MTFDVDVAIIGAGTAGLSAVSQVRKQTDRWVLVEAGPYGTTCARVGCMPSKVLIQTADDFDRRHVFGELGILGAEALKLSIPEVMRRVRQLRDQWVSGVIRSGEGFATKNIRGRATIIGPQQLLIDQSQQLSAASIVIATGSTPMVPEPWQSLRQQGRLVTTDEFFELPDLPQKMAVIGLGVIGVELGQALAKLGVEVVAVEASAVVAGQSDPEVAKFCWEKLGRGMRVVRGQAQLAAAPGSSGVLLTVGAHQESVDLVLACLGRQPNITGLGLENLGVPLNQRGMPPFDRHTLQIPGTRVFFAGDVNGDLAILHEAADEGRIAGLNAVAKDSAPYRRRTPLSICFSEPNICQVGRRYAELALDEIVIGEVRFENQGRAKAMSQNEGLLRLYARRSDGRLLGAAMAAPRGEHLAHLLAWVMQQELSVFDVLKLPFYHPVVEEGLRTALRDAAQKLGTASGSLELAICESDCTQVMQ